MKKNNLLLILFATIFPVVSYGADVTWTDGGGDGYWETATNWSSNPSLPSASSNVTINTTVSAPPLFIDSTVEILSLNIGASANLGVPPIFGTNGPGSLQVDGNVTYSQSSSLQLQLPVIVGASSTWSGPLDFANNISLYKSSGAATTMTIAGTTIFETVVNLTIDNATTNSAVNVASGSATFTGATIKIFANTGYAPVAGNSWTFTNSNFSGATLDTSNITLGAGLSWSPTATFLSTGVLTVVPEPTTWALLAGSLTTVMVFRRRRPQA